MQKRSVRWRLGLQERTNEEEACGGGAQWMLGFQSRVTEENDTSS